MMKNEVLYLLLDRYADHEAVFLASAIACDERNVKEHPKYINKVVAPTLAAVRSCSGFSTLPDYSFDTMPDDYAALVLIGGFGRLDRNLSDSVAPIVRRAMSKGIIVGAICNAAAFMASHGFLNGIRHTGNGLEQLRAWGGAGYTNEAGYVDAQAVSDGCVVTANGTGYLEFAKELLILLENDTPEQIERFYIFNKLGLVECMRRMRQQV